MPNKSYLVWERTKQWCIDHPGKPAMVAMVDGEFILTWQPKTSELLGTDPAVSPPRAPAPEEKEFQVGDRVNYVLPRSPSNGRPETVRYPGTITRVNKGFITVKIDKWLRTRTTSKRFLEPLTADLAAVSPPRAPAQELEEKILTRVRDQPPDDR